MMQSLSCNVAVNGFVWACALLALSCHSAPLPGLWDSPCFALNLEAPVTRENLMNTTTGLVTSITVLEGLINDSKLIMTTEYVKDTSTVKYLELDANSFLDPQSDKTVATEVKHQTATVDAISTLQEHYSLLSELAMYVDAVLAEKQGKIPTDSRHRVIKSHIQMVQKQIYETICSVKIGLLGQGSNVHGSATETYSLSDAFKSASTPYTMEVFRAYVVLADCTRVIHYLSEIYDTMNEAISS